MRNTSLVKIDPSGREPKPDYNYDIHNCGQMETRITERRYAQFLDLDSSCNGSQGSITALIPKSNREWRADTDALEALEKVLKERLRRNGKQYLG